MFTFREIQTEDAKMILDWRTSKRVAKYMKTEVNHGVSEQEEWIVNCRKRADFYHWVIVQQEQDIGYLSLSEYDPASKTASWGFYVGDEEKVRLGGLVPPFFYSFCFEKLGLERIYAEMLYFNTAVIDLHRLHGYEFCPERDRVLHRNGKEHLLIAMGLNRKSFETGKFSRFRTDFPIQFWKPEENKVEPLSILLEEIADSEEHKKILYDLLTNRKHRISHAELPSWEEHARFVSRHPYRTWWLIHSGENTIGSVYLTKENALGINLVTEESAIYRSALQKIIEENEPLPPIPSVRPEFLFVNVAPGNHALLDALSAMGTKLTQKTYRL